MLFYSAYPQRALGYIRIDYNWRKESSMTKSDAALAFIAGIGAGVAAGILMAPRGGEETRQRLKNKALETHAKVMDHAEKQREKLLQGAQKAAEKAEDTLEKGKEATEQAQNKIRQFGHRANDAT
jgi:gas vesicle protein